MYPTVKTVSDEPSQTHQSYLSNILEESNKLELEDLFSLPSNPLCFLPHEYESNGSFTDILTLSDNNDLLEETDHLLVSSKTPPNLKLLPNMMEFCRALNSPTLPQNSEDYHRLNELERVLLSLCFGQRHRNPLRKEQVFKKVIILCFKLITRDFENEVYVFNKFPKKALKVEMLKHYFKNDAAPFVVMQRESPFNPSFERSNFTSLNFSKAIMSKIAKCEELRIKILHKIAKIKQQSEHLYYRHVLKFLAECEKWINQHSPKSASESLAVLFSLTNSSGKKRGIHVPWSVAQLIQGCESTATTLTTLAGLGDKINDRAF